MHTPNPNTSRRLIVPQTGIDQDEINRMIEKFNDVGIVDGIPRWKSNGAIPFPDMLDVWIIHGNFGHQFDYQKAVATREHETAAFLAEYRARMANVEPSVEEMAEMRANFESGTTIVNVITGRRITL